MKINISQFWEESNSSIIPIQLTDELVKGAETKLGFKLPKPYVDILKVKNGGHPINTCYPTKVPTSWSKDHISIDDIRGIGGDNGVESEYERSNDEDWGYPVENGIVICDCPSAGHDAVMLDYSICGKDGEPRVIHVDVEVEETTFLADNFETFINGLVHDSVYDDYED